MNRPPCDVPDCAFDPDEHKVLAVFTMWSDGRGVGLCSKEHDPEEWDAKTLLTMSKHFMGLYMAARQGAMEKDPEMFITQLLDSLERLAGPLSIDPEEAN